MGLKLNSKFYAQIDEAIRAGNLRLAAESLKSISLKSVPRGDYSTFARIARRAGLPRLAVRLLNPVVRPERGKRSTPADDFEKAEYAASLIRLGAIPEAMKLLEGLPPGKVPESLLFRAFALIQQWRYREAIPVLDGFLEHPLDDYQRLIAKVNLVAALTHVSDRERARTTVEDLIEKTSSIGAFRLRGNLHEISAQLHLQQRRVAEARESLRHAQEPAGSVDSLDGLFVRKWTALCDFIETDGSPEARERLMVVRAEAGRRTHWETVRDIDFQIARHSQNRDRFLHVFFGTPFADYRRSLLASAPPGLEIPDSYLWQPGLATASAARRIFDLHEGGEGPRGVSRSLRPGKNLLNLMRVLSSDFYRPFSQAALFSELFPDEYHDPKSSPHRIHELVLRLRAWLSEAKTHLCIQATAGAYRLAARRPYALRVFPESRPESSIDAAMRTLKGRFPERAFSSEEAGQVLGTTPRTALRILSGAVAGGRLSSHGARSNRAYRIV